MNMTSISVQYEFDQSNQYGQISDFANFYQITSFFKEKASFCN